MKLIFLSQSAIVRSKSSFTEPVVAMRGLASLHSLPDVKADQSSSSHMWMERNADSLQAGWIVIHCL